MISANAPLQGDTGGHTGTAPTNLHYIFPRIPHKQNNHLRAIRPNETVGAVPVCPPERPHSGVSIPKTHALCAGILTMNAPLQGDTGGHTGAAPTNLHQTTRCTPTA